MARTESAKTSETATANDHSSDASRYRVDVNTIPIMIPRLKPFRWLAGQCLPQFLDSCMQPAHRPGSTPDFAAREAGSFEQSGFAPQPHTWPGCLSVEQTRHRAVFFGEQHHQPQVLQVQLQVLSYLTDRCEANGSQLHLVMEMFNLNDQLALRHLGRSDSMLADPELSRNGHTSEGFLASHYAPLVDLARAKGVPVWPGFPPRSWARLVMAASKDDAYTTGTKSLFDEIHTLDCQRYQEQAAKLQEADLAKDDVIPALPQESWNYVEQISHSHRAYLRSLFHPDASVQVPPGVSVTEDDAPPGTNASSPPRERHGGFLPAQTIKDTYLAHVVSHILRRGEQSTRSEPPATALVICGIGHCEYGFGAPERLDDMMAEAPGSLRRKPRSVVVASKPTDSPIWAEKTWTPPTRPTVTRGTGSPLTLPPLPAWHGWRRDLADAVVLYDWTDASSNTSVP